MGRVKISLGPFVWNSDNEGKIATTDKRSLSSPLFYGAKAMRRLGPPVAPSIFGPPTTTVAPFAGS